MEKIDLLINAIEKLNTNIEKLFNNNVSFEKSNIKFITWVFEYLEKYRKQYQSKQYYTYTVRRVEMYCKPYFKDMLLADVTTDILQDFFSGFNKTNTRDKVRVILKGALTKAVGLKMIADNPFDMVDIKNHKVKNRKPLTYKQQRLLFRKIDNADYLDVFFKMCVTGLRLSECYSVKIDNRRKLIYVDMPDNEKKKHERLIPYLTTLNINGNELLPKSKTAVTSYFKRLFKDLKLDICIHCFRHTFISVCNDVGFDIKWIQQTAGHTDILTTLNTYTKLLEYGTSPIKEYLINLKKQLKK